MNSAVRPKARFSRLHLAGAILTVFGLCLFAYFIYEAGIGEIWDNISRLGFGFLLILGLYAVKLSTRVWAWTMCVEKPYKLGFVNAFRAVMMGEALSAMIPLGILISGTSKAVAVRSQLPFVVALSSVATENLFYSLATSLLILGGGASFVLLFHPAGSVAVVAYVLMAAIIAFILFGVLMVVRQWHLASMTFSRARKMFPRLPITDAFAANVRRFEDLIFGFYRHQPYKFFPVLLLQFAFHAIGVLEVWLILSIISDFHITFLTAFLLETINRLILVLFKLIPFLVGVDEAGARFVTETLELGAPLGVTLAVVRKGRVLVWTALGMILIARSGLSFADIRNSDAALDSAQSAES